eukprot:CAMPEP_0177744972 /NCGR_PEP_ID=MMETSP0484_2-20121128/30051_1 /TAXON_ID=354590 /ORGANISM="Rhodomonas lens, Strain RHODO" /LENGTH=358 /DNA_ID=CAMNT_0019259551 /DNA_START=330 /DNA_END=1403 /DNA_ORIENTATION=-
MAASRPGQPTPTRCYCCSVRRSAQQSPSLICPACLAAKLKSLREETEQQKAKAAVARDKLNAEILRFERQRQRSRQQALQQRIVTLRESCARTRDQMFEGRIDAADLRYRTIEKEQEVTEAWGLLKQKQRDVVTMVLEPLRSCLEEEVQVNLEELAELRKSKVLQAMEFFQVGVGSSGAEIQGMPLPRYIHSFNRGGSIAECMAITQLGRLTDIVARYLNIPLPFAIDYKPSQCIIRGGGREGNVELALSPPLHTVSGAPPSSASGVTAASSSSSDEDWMRQYRRALHLLALNVRHLLWTQIEEGTEEEEAYAKICATNDVSPLGTLQTLKAVCQQRRLGHGEVQSCEYAYAQEKLFA